MIWAGMKFGLGLVCGLSLCSMTCIGIFVVLNALNIWRKEIRRRAKKNKEARYAPRGTVIEFPASRCLAKRILK